MSTDPASRNIHLRGEVIETLEENGRCIVKVALKSCYIEFAHSTLPKARLGDTIDIDTDLSIPNPGRDGGIP